MFPTAPLLAALLTIPIAASPVQIRSTAVTLPFAKRINTDGGPISPVHHDQAHVASLAKRSSALTSGTLDRRDPSGSIDVDLKKPLSQYIASVGIGSPPTTYNLAVQLTTSNTFVGADKAYVKTSTSKDFKQPVEVMYSYNGSFFAGEEWLDTLTLAPGLVVTDQSIGVADIFQGWPAGVDGVLGLGPMHLTLGTLYNRPLVIFPAVLDNLYNQGMIAEQILTISFPLLNSGNVNDVVGELAFGIIDSSKYIGDINYAAITKADPADTFWGIDLSITYGSDQTIQSETPGLVDTETSLLLISPDAYKSYQAVTSAVEDASTRMLKLTTSQYDNLQNLYLHIGFVTYTLTPNAQIWPRALNSYIGGDSGAIYSIVGCVGDPSVNGLYFVLGQTFLERYYTVLDFTHTRVGFAETKDTYATTN